MFYYRRFVDREIQLPPDNPGRSRDGQAQANPSYLYENPLTLKFVAAIVKSDGELPKTKAELYERSVAKLRLEQNSRLRESTLARLSEEEALNSAGAMMAVMLIIGKDSITKISSDEGAFYLFEITDILEAETLEAVLGSNLFKAESSVSPNRFLPLHRTVAEFLGARWLAHEVIIGSLWGSPVGNR